MKIRYLILALACLFPACSAMVIDEPGIPISFDTIIQSTGAASHVTNSGSFVLTNTNDYRAMQQYAFNSDSYLPGVEFPRQTVIAVFQGVKNSTGYQITVRRVAILTNSIAVYVTEASPRPGDNVGWAFTYPCHIIRYDSTNLPVVFEYD